MVYELFVSTLPSPAFTASDVLDLYLHRGSFETVLADEDDEQRFRPMVFPYPLWPGVCPNSRPVDLESPIRTGATTLSSRAAYNRICSRAWKPKLPRPKNLNQQEASTPAVIYGPPQWARPSFTHGFPGSAFTPQPDGTLRCPANHPLYPQERRLNDGSLRVLYAARIGHCRSCPLRAQCQESSTTLKPRRVSAVLWPLDPLLSRILRLPPDTAAPTACLCSSALARLAALWHPANLAQSDPQPNHLPGKLLSVLVTTHTSVH